MATPITIPDCALRVLERLYPTVDWSRVVFLSGLPFWVSSGTAAITLPDPINAWGFRVYLGTSTNFCDAADMATLVHEAMHVAQFSSPVGGYGLGFLRPGFVGYFACHFANGYDNNPYEKQADEQESKFRKCYGSNKVCDCASGEPLFNEKALDGLVACNETMVQTAPRAPFCPTLWWLLAGPLVGLLALLAFIVHWFDQVHCHTVARQYSRCVNWAHTTLKQCAKWTWQTINSCVSWGQQSTQSCADYGTQTTQACTQWGQTASSSCCTWAPCSWACKALVWVFTTVCLVWSWITTTVCILWTWLVVTVCLAFALISLLVCALWTFLVQLVCLLWATFWSFALFCWI